jgi:palmitoyltransferase ZDHHC9/14/18
MASKKDTARRPISPTEDAFPAPQFPRSEMAGPPSIISSRMTDIASDDGRDQEVPASTNLRRRPSDGTSRPGTARTGMSSSRGTRPPVQHLRKNYVSGLAAKRGSIGAGSMAGSISGRPPSSASRSHVPSLTSHAFFHPMSSQKLQAQRGGTRPPTTGTQQRAPIDDTAADLGGSVARQSVISNPVGRLARQLTDEGDMKPPPSRGTEMTDQETYDRITANTSPTHGHHYTGSMSESVRPLQKKPKENLNLSLNVDKGFKERVNLPTPMKSPRSFRSSFLLPGKSDPPHNGSNRGMHGAEKLSSAASSPRLDAADPEPRHIKSKEKNAKPANLGSVYQYFDGNTVFCFGGRFQNTKHKPVNIATGLAVVIPAVLFFVFSAPWLWFNISPAIPISFGYLFYVCISSFFHASVSDPGVSSFRSLSSFFELFADPSPQILPRNLHRFPPADENEDPLTLAPPTTDWALIKSAESSSAAMEVPVKHCRTCNIWRPPRAHHCRLCDNCIETHDHHCVWLNNCVGKRNYRYFFAFVSSASLISWYLIGASLTQILVFMNRRQVSFGDAINEFKVPFAMVIYGFVAGLYPAALMGYHIFLMARGETTREYINSHKFTKKERFRAFTQGNMMKNWMSVLCRPRPPTYYRFKGKYGQGDQRLGERRDKRPRSDSVQGMEMQDVKPVGLGFQGPVSLRNETNRSAQ